MRIPEREIDEAAWNEWVKTRPEAVRAVCERVRPDRLYRMKSTGSRVTVYSYSEDGTVTVDITGQYNLHMFDRQVFGIDPNDLEECDLPVGEPLGEMLNEAKDVDAYIDAVRPFVLKEKEKKPSENL